MTTAHQIQTIVAAHYGETVDSILGPRRFRSLAWARQVAMHFAAKFTRSSDADIGIMFSDADIGIMFNRTGRDVRHARKQVKNICETDFTARNCLLELEAKLVEALKKEVT